MNSTMFCKRWLSTALPKSFHKRVLPMSLVPFASAQGKQIFREALYLGGMESYFPLSEQFITQSEPSYCSITSLAMVLNALNFDPKKVWKGAWRWVSEETLQCESKEVCGHSLERISKDGMNFNEFESLAKCHNVKIKSYRVSNDSTKEQANQDAFNHFKTLVETVCKSDEGKTFIITNFSRKSLGQTGIGHFSPIGGYHSKLQLVLIMDVARFKYPPYWVHINDLWNSMMLTDSHTGEPRGYFVISGEGHGKVNTSHNVTVTNEKATLDGCPHRSDKDNHSNCSSDEVIHNIVENETAIDSTSTCEHSHTHSHHNHSTHSSHCTHIHKEVLTHVSDDGAHNSKTAVLSK